VSEPPNTRVRRQRRPRLSAALKAARQVGRPIKSAVIEADGRITITFDSDPTAVDANSDWDKKLEELERGKH
jgi:hypothetical protein